MKTKKLSADVVVVGSGPGGATIARDLVSQGKKVIVVEEGKHVKPRGTMNTFVKSLGGYLGMLGKGVMFTPDLLMMVRGVNVGGTTMFYTGTSWDPLYDKFKQFGVDLDPKETEAIKKELKVGPLPDDFVGPASKAIMKSAKELGYDWNKIDKFIDPTKGKITCNNQFCGDKKGAKWEAYQWIMDAVKKGATLMPETHADDVIIENNKATGVRATDSKGRQYEISAKAVVSCAGGVGSPAFLQRCGIAEAGKKFFFDPFAVTYGYINQKTEACKELAMTCGMYLPEDGIVLTDMTNTWFQMILFTAMIGRPLLHLKRKGLACIMIKAKDVMDGTIDIEGKITKPLTYEDKNKLNKGKIIARKILKNAGAEDIWYGALGAAHPGGTCRIGTVVDSNQETQIKNLFVSDGSVIPFEFGLPPVLTIISLSRRLSKHLMTKI